ncbi:hypothetical protein Bca101_036858 [Brassica carinata]
MEGSLSPSYGEEKRKNEGPSSSPSSAFEKLQDSDMLINTRLKSKHRDAYPPPPFLLQIFEPGSQFGDALQLSFNNGSTVPRLCIKLSTTTSEAIIRSRTLG